jgi:hypothetical protein
MRLIHLKIAPRTTGAASHDPLMEREQDSVAAAETPAPLAVAHECDSFHACVEIA